MQCMPFEWFWREPTIKVDWGKYENRLNVGGLLVTFLGVIIILMFGNSGKYPYS